MGQTWKFTPLPLNFVNWEAKAEIGLKDRVCVDSGVLANVRAHLARGTLPRGSGGTPAIAATQLQGVLEKPGCIQGLGVGRLYLRKPGPILSESCERQGVGPGSQHTALPGH